MEIKYIPVNIDRENEYIATATEVYPTHLLETAYSSMSMGNLNPMVLVENNQVRFANKPEILWYVDEVMRAYEAYKEASKNGFSFYEVRNQYGMPALFVSKLVRKSRIVVDANTFQVVALTEQRLLKRVARLIDKHCMFQYLRALFQVAYNWGNREYLESIVVCRGTDLQYLAVSPILNHYAENTACYEMSDIEAIDVLLNDADTVVYGDYSSTPEGKIMKTGEDGWTIPMTRDHACQLLTNYINEVEREKGDYRPIWSDDLDDVAIYISTNLRYIVDAFTFERRTVTNARLVELLRIYINEGKASQAELAALWDSAKGGR